MKQIIAIGGGQFTNKSKDALIVDYILKNTHTADCPLVCLLPTASGDESRFILKFCEVFANIGARPSFLSLFALPTADIESFIMEKDVICVGGGNSRSMWAVWKEWGMADILRKAYEAGKVMAGISAGAMCWFSGGSTSSVPGELSKIDGMGILPQSFSPHFGQEGLRRPTMHQLIKEGELPDGYGVDDGAALHFEDGKLKQAVRFYPRAEAYFIKKDGDSVIEEELAIVDLTRTMPEGSEHLDPSN
jgi:peptidase E